MSRRFRAAVIAALVMLPACGGAIAPGAQTATPSATSTPSPAVTQTPTPTEENLDCPKAVLKLVEKLDDINSRLDVGMTQDKYNDRVGDAKVAYDKVGIDDIGLDCLSEVAVRAEKALNAYISANNIWNDCITSYSCDTSSSSFDNKLQKKWSQASNLLEKIDRALR